MTTHPAGHICWVELVSPDHAAALPFYAALLGLDPVDNPASFAFIRKGGLDVGAAYTVAGGRHGWLPYVASADVARTVERARDAGGTVLSGPSQIGDAGWSATVAGPEGISVGIWQAGTHPGFGLWNAPGGVCLTTRHSRRAAEVAAFLTSTFEWDSEPKGPGHTILRVGTATAIDLVAMDERWGEAAPGWIVFFGVSEAAGVVSEAERLGGKVLHGPRAAEGMGEFAVMADPQGLTFGVIRPEHFD